MGRMGEVVPSVSGMGMGRMETAAGLAGLSLPIPIPLTHYVFPLFPPHHLNQGIRI